MAYYTPDSTPLHKVTIIPRGESGGHTSFLHERDINFWTKAQLLAQLDVLMGGRVGEEVAFGPNKVTTGAGDDFKKATTLAENMVARFGLSEKLGPRVLSGTLQDSQLSQATRDTIDSEVNQILGDALERARRLLMSHKREHKALADALLHYETLTKAEVEQVIAGKLTPPREPRPPQPQPPSSEPTCLAAPLAKATM